MHRFCSKFSFYCAFLGKASTGEYGAQSSVYELLNLGLPLAISGLIPRGKSYTASLLSECGEYSSYYLILLFTSMNEKVQIEAFVLVRFSFSSLYRGPERELSFVAPLAPFTKWVTWSLFYGAMIMLMRLLRAHITYLYIYPIIIVLAWANFHLSAKKDERPSDQF